MIDSATGLYIVLAILGALSLLTAALNKTERPSQ